MIRFFLVACVLSFASMAYSNPIQVGPTQVWVDTPDYAALEATGTQEDILDAFRDALHSVNVNAQNPNGLTLNGAIDVFGDFDVNIDDLMLPCDHVIDAIEDNLTDPSMPAAVLRAVVKDGIDCVEYGNVIIGAIGQIGVRKPQICIKEVDGVCVEFLQNYPCHGYQELNCECVLEDENGDCQLWINRGPFGPVPGGPGGPPAFPIDDPDPIEDPGLPGTGGGDPGEGGGGGGGGDPGAAGVSSTVSTGDCDESGSTDQTGPNGPSTTTPRPVLRAAGYKYEDDTDIVISLPGRDFALRRTYNASPMAASRTMPWMLGGGWGTTVDGWVSHVPLGDSVDAMGHVSHNADLEYMRVTLMPLQNSKRYFRENPGTGPFIPGVALNGGPADSEIVEVGTLPLYQYQGQNVSTWKMKGEGAGYTAFAKEFPFSDGSFDSIIGRIIQQSDGFGNIWYYHYLITRDENNDVGWPRLESITFNGPDRDDCDAVMDFEWDLGTIQSPGTGRLRSIMVLRPHSQAFQLTPTLIPTQYVNYTYAQDKVGQDYPYWHLDQGNMNGLVLVEKGNLVNAPMPGEEVNADFIQNEFEYHKQFTHYRYNQFIVTKEHIVLDQYDEKNIGLMTHRFEPEQMEHFAEQWLESNTGTYEDAVEAFVAADLDEIIPGSGGLAVGSLASKFVSYYGLEEDGGPGSGFREGELAFRVKHQSLQAGCGCGGSGGFSRKEEHFRYAKRLYVDGEVEFQFQYGNASGSIPVQSLRESSVTIFTEGLPHDDDDNTDDPVTRTTYTWSEDQKVHESELQVNGNGGWITASIDTVHSAYTIGNYIVETSESGDVREWASFHDFDPVKLTRTQRYHPSAVISVDFEDGTNNTNPTGLLNYIDSLPVNIDDRSAKDAEAAFNLEPQAGLVEMWEYNDFGRITKHKVKKGGAGQEILLSEKEYFTADGLKHLPKRVTQYADDGVTKLLETEYAYTTSQLFGNLLAPDPVITEKKTTVVVEGVLENGPSGSNKQISIEKYELGTGRLTEVEHPDGTITSYSYSRTVDQSPAGDGSQLFSQMSRTDDWLKMSRAPNALNNGRPDLVTQNFYDSAGRLRSTVSPEGITAYTSTGLEQVELYKNDIAGPVMDGLSNLEYLSVTTYPHDRGVVPLDEARFTGPATKSWASAGYNLLREDAYEMQHLAVDDDTKAVTSADLALTPASQTIHLYTPSGSHYESRVWHDIDAMDVAAGSYRTQYDYDVLGRLNRMVDHSGTVTQTEYDADNRTTKVWVYPEGATPVLRSEFFYDHEWDGAIPKSGPGNGNLTLVRKYTSDDPLLGYRDTVHVYDWRNRKRMSFAANTSAGGPYTTSLSGTASATLLDNLGRPVESASLKGADHSLLITGLKDDSVTSLFGADTASLARTEYNRRGLVWATETAIDPSDDAVGFLRSENWYDTPGRLVTSLSPNSAVSKTEYDEFGRVSRSIVTDGNQARSGAPYASVVSLADTGNVIFEESEISYDDLGRVEMTTSSTRSDLEQDPGTAPGVGLGLDPVTIYSVPLYDDASRPIATVSYGTNTTADIFSSGGAPPMIPMSVPDPTASVNEKLIISQTVYDELGRPYMAIDPLGRKHISLFDDLGRAYASIENYIYHDNFKIDVIWDQLLGRYKVVNRNPSDGVDVNRVTSSVFDFAGATTKRVAHLLDGSVQVTQYNYDPNSLSFAHNDSDLYGNLYKIQYPNPVDGVPGTANEDTVEFGYNHLGEQVASRDQNGTIRLFERDELGRLTEETINILGTGVDAGPTVLVTEYDDQGRVVKNQSLDGTTVLDEVVYGYNPRGDLITLTQLAKDGTTPKTFTWQYVTQPWDYLDPTSGNEHRLEAMVYPDGSKLVPEYGDPNALNPLDSRIDRVVGFSLQETDYLAPGDELRLVSYEHLGLGTVAKVDFGLYQTDRSASESGARGVSGQYPGWDRFGRLKQHTTVHSNWGGGGQGQLYSESFTYDQVSNRLTKKDLRLSAIEINRDWKYEYDQLNRLSKTNRGIHTNGTDTNDQEGSRAWTLDELGNWDDVETRQGDGTLATEVRTHNATNEVTQIGSSTVAYDHNGNMTEFNGRLFVYDAWNRLVRIHATNLPSSAIIAEYDYNALHWRVAKRANNSSGVLTQHLSYYTPSWQLAYEDIDSSYVEASGHISDSFASQYWGKRHIDDALYRAIDDDDGTADGIYERGFAYLLDNQFSVIGMFDLMNGSAHERLRYDAYGQPTHSYPEDLNGDGLLDGFDVFEFTGLFGNSDPRVDFDFNGLYEFFDTSLFLDGFGNKPAIGSGRISDDGAYGPGNSLGFMGYRWDPEAGLWLGRNRMYSPEAGRWLQRDPAGYVDGLSMYLFVRGNPLSYIDPMGLCADNDVQSLEKELGIERGVGKGGNVGGALTKAQNEKLRELYSDFEDDMADAGKEMAKAAAFVAMIVVPGPEEIILAAVMSKMGWVAKGGKLVDKAGDTIDANKAKKLVEAEKAAPGSVVNKVDDTPQVTKNRAMGLEGEKAVRATYEIGSETKIKVGGRTRKPDGLTDTTLSEVKNVQNLSATSQIRDFLYHATENGLAFDLYVKPNGGTKLSGPLQRMVDNGYINLKFIPEG